jgi:hypothetical protein
MAELRSMKSCCGRKRTARVVCAVIVAAATAGFVTQAATPRSQPGKGRPLPANSKLFEGSPPHHIGDYPSFRIAWQRDARLQDVTAVFPHPLMAQRIVLTTAAGLVISDDAGKTWKELPGTGRDAIGAVRHVEFSPASPDIFLASAEKGVWQIADIAKPPVQIATKAKGLISDAVAQVRVDPSDPRFRTLVAVHAPEAAGISRSIDGGKTWRAMPGFDDYYIEKLFPGGPGVPWAFAMASMKDPSAAKGVYFCHEIGDFLKEYAGEIQANDCALELIFRKPFSEVNDLSYWATASSGLIKTEHAGTNIDHVGPQDGAEKWTSIGITWGATADSKIFYGYSPAKLGFAYSEDNGETFAPKSEGLPTGRIVRQGAQVRANAGGSVFFAAVNGGLYIGRRYTGTLAISDIRVSCAAISYAPNHYTKAFNEFRTQLDAFRNRRPAPSGPVETLARTRALRTFVSEPSFTIAARIGALEDEKDIPLRVTVDLSRVGGSGMTTMFDDGLHDDGEANDGIYGATCFFRPDRMRNLAQDTRRPTPGPMALTITALAQDGSLSSAIGVIGMLERPETHIYWSPTGREQWKDADGGITGAVEDPKSGAQRRALRIDTTDKPWSMPLNSYYEPNVRGFSALSFDVKCEGAPAGELFVQLKDFSEDTVAMSTVRVPVVKEKLIEGGVIDGTWRRVVVPFSMLLEDPPGRATAAHFRPGMLRAAVISGEAGAPRHFWISPIRFHAGDENDTAKEGGD